MRCEGGCTRISPGLCRRLAAIQLLWIVSVLIPHHYACGWGFLEDTGPPGLAGALGPLQEHPVHNYFIIAFEAIIAVYCVCDVLHIALKAWQHRAFTGYRVFSVPPGTLAAPPPPRRFSAVAHWTGGGGWHKASVGALCQPSQGHTIP